MSMASSAQPAVVRSHSNRRQNSYAPEGPQRSRSTTTRTSAPSTARRASYDRPPPAQQATLAKIAQRDYETANVARPRSSRRSSSQDRNNYNPPQTHSQYNPAMSGTTAVQHSDTSNGGPVPVHPAAPAPAGDRSAHNNGMVGRRRTTIDSPSGHWALGKTIGAGSMGKVKLAKSLETGEQVAVKIVPRQSAEEHHNTRDAERADRSKEIRTAREAAIVCLLNHPFICSMKDVVRTHYHWYMIGEYVNGGQMLDYIISHGRLKEKQARKFGRQIASALDYCHRNSIVHRDLKIENILISKTGDIKIIDFGLSNLFAPRGHLKTFCGSLYFAAPELLQAKQYTGPEVDVWSFGIVLYVLVCGKVPFDDQSMPQLHAKIKRGVVDYPQWLSSECRNLISRMLVTDPRQRATLQEIMNHSWMVKGFSAPPENYLPPREPLALPLDPEVIDKMTGFDFGSAEYITTQLTKVLESEEYQHALRLAREQTNQVPGAEKPRGFMGFYKRRNSANSKDILTNSSTDILQLGNDPINAFHPLISVYYLVREKQERERAEANPGVATTQSGEQPLKLPDLPAPEAAYTNIATPEMPGEKPTGGRTRARAKTQGEDDIVEGVKKIPGAPPAILAPPDPAPPKKESMATGILRRFSTRKHREPRDLRSQDQAPAVQLQPPNDAGVPLRKSFSVRRARNREPSPSVTNLPTQPQAQDPAMLGPPVAESGWKVSKGLGRSASVASGEHRRRQQERRGVSAAAATPPSPRPSVPAIPNGVEAFKEDLKSDLPVRSATSRAKSLGHARRESIQARRARREEAREANLPEEPEGAAVTAKLTESTENMKPVYLKGLFSVSTTSSKPLAIIRADIIRVLKQLGVEFTEVKGGFSCRHSPSIDLNKSEATPPSPPLSGSHRRHISLGFIGGDREREGHDSPKLSKTRSSSRRRPANADHSLSNSEDSEEYMPRPSMAQDRDRIAGETTTRVQNDLGDNMVLRFEVFVVKVPLFNLHGIQFKKVAGGTWQYKNMAQRILDALRL
ncbi:MAG: serine/threonine-protein kinase KIN2 [Cirrosporium novae-zelandiae]|nr:MAG: serine/threonine-protein kinase KIN2 [Cirrosporium novae-zelandiae]